MELLFIFKGTVYFITCQKIQLRHLALICEALVVTTMGKSYPHTSSTRLEVAGRLLRACSMRKKNFANNLSERFIFLQASY